MTPRMVRGLDYYTRTTFEIVHEGALGSQNAVLGGGRYDGLAESLGSRVAAPGIGFSIGEDRLVMTVEEGQPGKFGHVLDLFIAPLDEASFRHVSLVARELRGDGIVVELAAAGKVKRSMELASKLGARFALLVGEDEVAKGQYSLKNLETGEQISVPRDDLKKHICQKV